MPEQRSGSDLNTWNWQHDPARQSEYERANWQHRTYYGPDVDPSSPDSPAEQARRKQGERQVMREAPPFQALSNLASHADWAKFEREARPSQYVEENRDYSVSGPHPRIDTSQAEAAAAARYNPTQPVAEQGPLSHALGFGNIGGSVPLPRSRPAIQLHDIGDRNPYHVTLVPIDEDPYG